MPLRRAFVRERDAQRRSLIVKASGHHQHHRGVCHESRADGDRRVTYVCALAYVEPGGRRELVHGRCEGTLALSPRGEGGFGYDPAFLPDDGPGGRTMAELSRGRAARALVQRLLEAEDELRLGGGWRRRRRGGAGSR